MSRIRLGNAPLLPGLLLSSFMTVVVGMGIIPTANCQALCIEDCGIAEALDVPQDAGVIPLEPFHPLADTNSAEFRAALAKYLSFRQASVSETVEPRDPLHPLAKVESPEFASAMDVYQRAAAAARMKAQSGPADPLHPLADTESGAFKAALAAYVAAQQNARSAAESSLPESMRPPFDGPANQER